jgi:hypothetical protein
MSPLTEVRSVGGHKLGYIKANLPVFKFWRILQDGPTDAL